MYTGLTNMKTLPRTLALHAWHVRRCARRPWQSTDGVYELAYRAIFTLSQDIKRLKPKRARRKMELQFGHPTLGALVEKHLGPVQDILTARAYRDEEIRQYLWPDEVTLESYQTYSKGMKFRGSSLGGSEGDAIALLGDAVWNIALVLLPSVDYRRPRLCRLCYRHTDPKSQSVHCLKHSRANGRKPTGPYKQGQATMASAVAIIGSAANVDRLREFVAKMRVACHRPDTEQFLGLVQEYCSLVWEKFGRPEQPEQSLFDAARQLGRNLEDPYAAEWVDAMERCHQRILPEPKFDPSKVQIIDPEEIDRRMNTFRVDVTEHLCVWLVGAEAFLAAEKMPRRRGRPTSESSRTATVRRLLRNGKLSRKEIAKAAKVSIGLVHRLARAKTQSTKD